jgi:alpha-L-fucosidase 2
VRGGGSVAGDKEQYITYIFQPLADAGFAWFSINYRLAPQYEFPADVEDVEAAISCVRANADKYKVDPNRIALIGESAGGQPVSFLGAQNRPGARVAAVVSMYGIHDFVSASVEWKPIPEEILQLLGIRAVDAEFAPILIKAFPALRALGIFLQWTFRGYLTQCRTPNDLRRHEETSRRSTSKP